MDFENNLQMKGGKSSRGGKSGSSFSVFAGQSALVEQLVFSASNQTGMTLVAKEKTVSIPGNSKAGKWPETSCWWVWVDLSWALEANHCFWVALLQQHIGPVASMYLIVVNQSLGAWQLIWNSILALNVACRTLSAVFIDSKLIFTSRCGDCSCYKENRNFQLLRLNIIHHTYDRVCALHIRQPSCSCSGYELHLFHRTTNRSHMSLKSTFRSCRGRTGRSSPDERKLERHKVQGSPMELHSLKISRKQRKSYILKAKARHVPCRSLKQQIVVNYIKARDYANFLMEIN